MPKPKSSFTIICGKVPSSPSDECGLMTFTLASIKEVKDAACAFTSIIPDELDYYHDLVADLIADWTGDAPLTFSHQDDDYFVFTAHPKILTNLVTDADIFTNFIADHKVDDFSDD